MIKTIFLHFGEHDVAESQVTMIHGPFGKDDTPLVNVLFPTLGDDGHYQGTVSLTWPNYASFQGWLARMTASAVDAFDAWVLDRDACGGGDLPEAA